MRSIDFKTCQLTEYAINGDESHPIRINLRDVNLKKRIEQADVRMKEILETYGDTPSAEGAIAADVEIRACMNDVFGTDVCTPAFGATNCLTMVDDLPLFAHFFHSFTAMIVEDIKAMVPKAMAGGMGEASPLAGESKANGELNATSDASPIQKSKVEQYVAPIVERVQPAALPDLSALTLEQKAALLKQLQG